MSAKAKIITLITVLLICIAIIVYGTITDGNSVKDILPRLILMILTAIVIIVRLISDTPKKQSLNKSGLQSDMATAKEWIVSALSSSGYQVDFSLESLKDIDRFFDEENKPDGILAQNTGRILFALGVYVGETVISNVGGAWVLDNCSNETNISVKIDEQTSIFPVIRIMARYQHGNANSLYVYGQSIKDNENVNGDFKVII